MIYKEIGNSGIECSVIALGAWAIGGGPFWGKTDDNESIRTINTALEAGINLIDTAPGYGFGKSEEIIGQAIKGKRDKVVISTKCGLWWKDGRGTPKFELEGNKVNICLRPETIKIEVEDSLRLLDTDYIDILHTHWQAVEPDKTPISETMNCLMELKKEGKIRAIAASNVTLEDVREYMKAGTLDAVQQKYSMLDRKLEDELLPYCRENQIGVLVYSPLEQALLTGRFKKDTKLPADVYRNNIPWFKQGNRERVLDVLDSWEDLTEKYSCSLTRLVIAWTIAQTGITVALCGARHPDQILENAGAAELALDKADISRIRQDITSLGDPVQ
ncbi:MAG TPA: aldo/keto reductase [Spirochaetes bacterium]|nr:aldo/keto reductase [Spirochaetota bacterium]